MSHVHPEEAHAIKKNGFFIMKGRPTKIVSVKVSKTGKHGHAKIAFEGTDLFTSKKYSDVLPGHIKVWAYELSRQDAEVQLIDSKERSVEVMDADGSLMKYNIEDNKVGDELIAAYDANEEAGGDKYYQVSILTAPVEGKPDEYELHSEIVSWKELQD